MKRFLLEPVVLFGILLLTTPAFYLVLTGATPLHRNVGYLLYAVLATLSGLRLYFARRGRRLNRAAIAFDVVILIGTAISAVPLAPRWLDWTFRLSFSALVFLRLGMLAAPYIVPHRLLQIVLLAIVSMALSGAGFLWLEPRVHSYADGLWLAFITGATVGYGDLVPSTPASRVFAAFIVLLGYTLFSIMTASLAAVLIGEDEKRLRHALHVDLRLLRNDIEALRAELDSYCRAQREVAQEVSRIVQPPD